MALLFLGCYCVRIIFLCVHRVEYEDATDVVIYQSFAEWHRRTIFDRDQVVRFHDASDDAAEYSVRRSSTFFRPFLLLLTDLNVQQMIGIMMGCYALRRFPVCFFVLLLQEIQLRFI